MSADSLPRVRGIASATILTAVPGSVVCDQDQPVFLVAVVTPSAATGTIRFSEGTTTLGPPVPAFHGIAHLVISRLATGTHTLMATYLPSERSAFGSSRSAPVTLTVHPRPLAEDYWHGIPAPPSSRSSRSVPDDSGRTSDARLAVPAMRQHQRLSDRQAGYARKPGSRSCSVRHATAGIVAVAALLGPLVGLGAWQWWDVDRAASGEAATGTVVETGPSINHCGDDAPITCDFTPPQVVVSYPVQGMAVTATVPVGGDQAYQAGERIPVRYDPADRTHAVIPDDLDFDDWRIHLSYSWLLWWGFVIFFSYIPELIREAMRNPRGSPRRRWREMLIRRRKWVESAKAQRAPDSRAAHARFAKLRGQYAQFECDPLAVLRLPALTDVTVPSTAQFVDAFAEAQALDTDTGVAPVDCARFASAVDRAWHAWHAARDAAERIRLADIPADERAIVERAIKLLTLAHKSDHEAERIASYATVRAELAKLERSGTLSLPPATSKALAAAAPQRAAPAPHHTLTRVNGR
jgi:Bacterial Ig-like domain (group 3)/Protein of unknown function (DUF3592)